MRRFGPLQIFMFILLFPAVGICALPAAAQYVYTPVDDPNASQLTSASNGTQPMGINQRGTVVGFYNDARGDAHGFMWTGGTNFTTIDFPGAVFTEPAGVNDAGVISGMWSDTNGDCHGFQWVNGSFTSFDFPGAEETEATGINNLGEITGFWLDAALAWHGFLLKKGSFSSFDFLGAQDTFPNGINDSEQVVGTYRTPSGGGALLGFMGKPGALSTLSLPDGSSFSPFGINNSSQIVGIESNRGGVLLDSGRQTAISPLNVVGSSAFGISNAGEIVGQFASQASPALSQGFLAIGPSLLDPVPDLMSGPAVASASLASVGLGGRVVKAIGADGVTEVVVRIPAKNVGDQIKLTLVSDQNKTSDAPDQNGGLGKPGDTTFSLGELTVTAIAVTTPDGGTAPFAFAVYRAPIDFARETAPDSYMSGSCPFASSPAGFLIETPAGPPTGPVTIIGTQPITDDKLACRSVLLQVSNLSDNTTSNLPVIILRPPVVMVHGLWSDWTAWNSFKPLVSDASTVDKRFYVGRVSYDSPVGVLISSSDPPAYESPYPLFRAKGNSLGFAFNAPSVLAQADGWIEKFKQGDNPVMLPAAVVQADIVAHSMGGDIVRTMALIPSFLNNYNYGQGSVHKLITIDTPHLGSPLAGLLLTTDEEGGCVEKMLAVAAGRFVFNSVSLDGNFVDGAIGDLAPFSPSLQAIRNQSNHPIPTALIAGIYSNFSSLSPGNSLIGITCSAFGDPLAQDLTPTRWPQIFGTDQSDAIVPEASQLDGFGAAAGSVFPNLLHSSSLAGFLGLGFSGTSVLDPDPANPVPNQVIQLLNTPVTQPTFVPMNP